VFFHILHLDPAEHVFTYIVAGWPGPFLSLGVGAVGPGETPCLIQEALDGGAVSAQAAHSWCHCYAFLLPGHKPQFFNY
jgi:hypothetical protein